MELEKNMKLVILIDADNASADIIEPLLEEIAKYGVASVKRIYGDWSNGNLKKWQEVLLPHAIIPIQQFSYTKGKNATDMAMVIDAMDLLYSRIFDGFCIVSSDSDFTPLAIKIHESGIYVIGVGKKTTPESFKNSCDEFILLENLESNKELAIADTKNEDDENEGNMQNNDINEIHNLLSIAFDKYQDDDGFVNVSSAGTYIKRAKPDFDSRTYGYDKLPRLIEAFPDKYEVKKYPGKGKVNIIAYKCKQPTTAST